MKKKLLFGLVAFAFFAILVFNITLMENGNASTFTLSSLITAVHADTEQGGGSSMGCFTSTVLQCPSGFGLFGGTYQICNQTGVYGPPYGCTETGCGLLSGSTRWTCHL